MEAAERREKGLVSEARIDILRRQALGLPADESPADSSALVVLPAAAGNQIVAVKQEDETHGWGEGHINLFADVEHAMVVYQRL